MGVLEALVGRRYGPYTVEASSDRVAAFTAAVGDDGRRWLKYVPPFFANVALFAAAPSFLADDAVVPFTRSLIHSEQHYAWSRPLRIGETVAVSGSVATVRARGPLNFVTFDLIATADDGPWLTASSIFLLSAEAAGSAEDQPEPAVALRPPFGGDPVPEDLPAPGEAVPEFRCGASRADLVRYAGASGDWNPIHWDHESARAAGLPGTIVHGLLMAAWMGHTVTRFVRGEGPLREARIRFRNPLRPASAAVVTGVVAPDDGLSPQIDLVLESAGERLATGRIRVTP
jgi:acyl dehydratase